MSIALEQARANARTAGPVTKMILGHRVEFVRPFQTGFALMAGMMLAALIPAALGLLIGLMATATAVSTLP